jgi:Cd2+/Zn2+-exporting ATPase
VVIATPAAMLSAIAAAGRQGVLFKGGAPVEAAASVRAIAFDKTGTLTEGSTRLTDAMPIAEGLSADELLAAAAAVQRRSEHHLARATVAAASARRLAVPASDEFRAAPGYGVSAVVGPADGPDSNRWRAGRRVFVGNRRQFAEATVTGWRQALDEIDRLEAEGKTAVVVVEVDGVGPQAGPQEGAAHDARALGVLAFADRVRSNAPAVVEALRRIGVTDVSLITGDNEIVARKVASAVGIDEVYAAALPERKVEIVRELHDRHGAVAMVGDGVNDAPALAAATLGVAMGGAGTDVALEAADLVLMGDDLTRLPYALALGRAARRTVAISLAFALGVVILLAATVMIEGLSLPLAVVGHEGSTVLVALNGLRLLAFRE